MFFQGYIYVLFFIITVETWNLKATGQIAFHTDKRPMDFVLGVQNEQCESNMPQLEWENSLAFGSRSKQNGLNDSCFFLWQDEKCLVCGGWICLWHTRSLVDVFCVCVCVSLCLELYGVLLESQTGMSGKFFCILGNRVVVL